MSEDNDDWISGTYRDPSTIAREGAASDGAQAENVLAKLPRLLRYAHLALRADPRERLLAEIAEVTPDIADGAVLWCELSSKGHWQPLAASLDAAAVTMDLPVCRSLADVVRLLSMTLEDLDAHNADALRVIVSLKATLREADRVKSLPIKLFATSEHMIVGWSILASGDRERVSHRTTLVHSECTRISSLATEYVRQLEREACARTEISQAQKAKSEPDDAPKSVEVPEAMSRCVLRSIPS